ncbi:DUF882 domain-containing protein [Dichotomicrobium thermohalophilum]|nr:DUF882 domain-containing protein [Dichotomicrobium thermohalophilum]
MFRAFRKLFQSICLTLVAAWGILLAAAAGVDATERRLQIYSVNTKESIDVVYKRDGEYIPEALDKIDWIMRDWRRDEKTKMSRELIDLIWEVHQQVGSKEPVHLISGYRSQKTNNMLRRTKGGQARKSQHILGNAADVHFPDVPVKRLRNAGLIRQYGGVGYYPTSAIPFVHLDVARVRHWPRLPRQELALLFPSGKTKHVPADGRPLRKKDVKVALAKLEKEGKPLPWATRQQLKRAPRPILASLGPAVSGFNLGEATEPETVQTASVPTPPEEIPAAPEPRTIARASVASAPAYDEEHADELYYQPFPLMPMIAEASIASMDFSRDTDGILKKVHMFFDDGSGNLPIGFESGLQYGELYWASRFSGRAVSRVLTDRRAEAAPSPKRARLAQR